MKIDDVITPRPKGRFTLQQEWFTFESEGEEVSVCISLGSPKLVVWLGGECRLIDAETLARRAVEIMREDRS